MDASLKKILKAVTLELRHILEGYYSADGEWHPGDLELRLAAIGVRASRESAPVDELSLSDQDKQARTVVDAYLQLREEASEKKDVAVAEFVRESAYTWANRLLALRCMGARGLVDEVILQKEVYGGRSLEHHRLAQREPELCAGEDDGLFEVLRRVFEKQSAKLPMLFDSQSPGIALRPSPAVLKRCLALLSGNESVRSNDPATDEVFKAPDALGWAYQYWNTEEKDRVFEKVRTQKGAKIEGADIVPATQLYTESYIVQFLVQNSLGATWMGMHPESKLCDNWPYYVRHADRSSVQAKPVSELTFLDPACGSGHFLLEAFDLLYAMYEEEGELAEPDAICDAILTKNLYGIDIDARSIQIAEVALWMKAAEKAFDYEGVPTNLVAAVSSHLKGPHWEEFLNSFQKEPSVGRVLRKFGESMQHIDELGSLARPNEELRQIIADEHAVWEKQVSERKESDFLFAEMRDDALSGTLPFHEITDEDFGDRLFYRARAALDGFTEQARERGDFQDQFLVREARTGFRLLAILAQRFDCVAANPPYMGGRNMGDTIARHLDLVFAEAKSDLFSAFIVLCLRLCKTNGFAALVTMNRWLYQSHFEKLRLGERLSSTDDDFDGLIAGRRLSVLADLGSRAFDSENKLHDGVQVCCQIARPFNRRCETVFLDSREGDGPSRKSEVLRDSCQKRMRSFSRDCELFSAIPGCKAIYSAPKEVFSLFTSSSSLGDFCFVQSGCNTTNNTRFIRYHWETPHDSRDSYFPYEKGGGYGKWDGFKWYDIQWHADGEKVKRVVESNPTNKHWSRRISSLPFYFREGLTYTYSAYGSLSVRYMPPGSIFDMSGISVFAKEGEEISSLAIYLNSRLATYLLRLVSRTPTFQPGTVASIPAVLLSHETASYLFELAYRLKQSVVSSDLTERAFKRVGCEADLLPSVALLHTLEGMAEQYIFLHSGISSESVAEITKGTGVPAGWAAIVRGYDSVPDVEWINNDSITRIRDWILAHRHVECDAVERESLKNTIRVLYEAGSTSGVVLDEERSDSTIEDNEESEETMSIEVPCDSYLEEMARRVGIHPLSVYWIIKDGVESDGWRCLTAERRFSVDLLSEIVLRMLGHQWPLEMGNSNAAQAMVELNGVMPLNSTEMKVALVERVYAQLKLQHRTESDIIEAIGTNVGEWLSRHFFSHHCSQFRKRPIAWHIQSNKSTIRVASAYACLVYYHRLDGDSLRKMQKQAEDSRKSRETELRGITAVAADSRSSRQEQRRVELENAVAELTRFEATLKTLDSNGFGPECLRQELHQYGIDDATIALKCRWLHRLGSLIIDTNQLQWRESARKANIHRDLPRWIERTITDLHHHCVAVGVRPPKVVDVGDSPSSLELAAHICKNPKEMLVGSLKLACDVWWKQFDDEVLEPIKQQIKALKAERDAIKERLNAEPEPELSEIADLKRRDKQLVNETKPLNRELRELKAKADTLRKMIERWRHPDVETWEPWLAKQPLFDEVASIDGKKAPPTTIAEFVAQESAYIPDLNDGVRVNIAPLQKAGILAADVLATKDVDKAIADRAEWRADERRWVREGKLPQPGWWPVNEEGAPTHE